MSNLTLKLLKQNKTLAERIYANCCLENPFWFPSHPQFSSLFWIQDFLMKFILIEFAFCISIKINAQKILSHPGHGQGQKYTSTHHGCHTYPVSVRRFSCARLREIRQQPCFWLFARISRHHHCFCSNSETWVLQKIVSAYLEKTPKLTREWTERGRARDNIKRMEYRKRRQCIYRFYC